MEHKYKRRGMSHPKKHIQKMDMSTPKQPPRYPAYQDSGVEWLGEIPEHWGVVKFKGICEAYGRIGFRGYNASDLVDKGEGAITLSPSNINEYSMSFSKCSYLSWEKYNESPEIKIYNDDLLIVKTGSTYGKIGRVKDLPLEATINPQLIVLKNVKCNRAFLYYQLNTPIIQTQIEQNVIGSTIPTLSESKILNFISVLPPLEEQKRIADFLDRKVAQLDQAIAQKEQLIALLKERRQVLIHRAVTRGLNPDAPLQHSGIDWIGEIPAHWEVRRLKHLVVDMISGPFGSSLVKDDYKKKGYKIYGQEQVIANDFAIGDYYISESKFQRMRRYEIYKGDILISCVGTFGKIALVPEEFEKGIINPRLIKFSPNKELIEPELLKEILLSDYSYSQFDQVSRGGTMGVININLLSQLLIIVPTPNEQLDILEYLQKSKIDINKAISQHQTQIQKLKEYKATLINAAVTGKIRV